MFIEGIGNVNLLSLLTIGVNDTSGESTAGVITININLRKNVTIVEIEDNLQLVTKTPVVILPQDTVGVRVPLAVNIGENL